MANPWPYDNTATCTCLSCGNTHTNGTAIAFIPFFDDFDAPPDAPPFAEPYRAPAEHILREQADRERAQQRQARASARRALSRVAGRRSHEQSRAMSVRALSLKRAA